ncbi:Integral membrane protein OS=Streptomyces glaucescens OX=1907 GN=SGLAU_12330 PE=4 SV=1 [Streptomyces glaucescens]
MTVTPPRVPRPDGRGDSGHQKGMEVPAAVGAAETPETPETPDTPEIPKVPKGPEAPDTLRAPDASGTPKALGSAGAPDTPDTPDTPEAPEAPEAPDMPDAMSPVGVPDAPDSPAAPNALGAAEARETPEALGAEAREAPETLGAEAPATPDAPKAPVPLAIPPARTATPRTAEQGAQLPQEPGSPREPGNLQKPDNDDPYEPGNTHAPGTQHQPEAPQPEAPQETGTPQNLKKDVQESRGFLARAALLTAVLSIAGSVLGLARDQALARLFGAGSDTDAFLVAWTVPEFAATLLIEDGLAFVLVPAFSLALARRARGASGDPVRALIAATAPRLLLALAAVAALVVAVAPHLVEALAPGLPDPALAVDCTRLTATCVLTFGLAGYCSAALRAHRRFLAPASIYVAYNTAIITGMFVLGGRWGVRSAAVGVAVGGCLMIAVQLPSLLRQLGRRSADGPDGEPAESARPVALALVATVLLFALCRQSQVLIERFLASHLPAGAISHLNYAQKVAQIPMTMSLMLCTVTFPVVARALADGDTQRARARVERDLALAASVVLLGTAAAVACAPQIVEVLFQRGAFTAEDTAATARVMRVYALGLLGQTLVGALIRSYFGAGLPTWYPVVAMTLGVVATSWIGAWAVGPGHLRHRRRQRGRHSLTAALLLAGTRRRGVVPIRVRPVLGELSWRCGRPWWRRSRARSSRVAWPLRGRRSPPDC